MWSKDNFTYFLIGWAITFIICGLIYFYYRKNQTTNKVLLKILIAMTCLFEIFKYAGEFSHDAIENPILLPFTICFFLSVSLGVFALTKENTSINRYSYVMCLILTIGISIVSLVAPDVSMNIPSTSTNDLWGFIYHYLIAIISFLLILGNYYKLNKFDLFNTLPIIFIWLCIMATFANIYGANYDMILLINAWWFSVIGIFAYLLIYTFLFFSIVLIRDFKMHKKLFKKELTPESSN